MMKFQSQKIKGKGRGKFLGFPTINLEIPKAFQLKDGIYVVTVLIDKKNFKGALHFGPVPTFNEKQPSLEVFLIDTRDENIPDLKDQIITINIVKRLREIKKFNSEKDLVLQIQKDVIKAKKTLNQR